METMLFYVFAALTLVNALLVVVNPFSRNPVTSAMFLVLAILSMAGLFVLLNAYFLAAVQILVYAGAVIVLFLFVIMLLDLQEEQKRHFQKVMTVMALAGVGLLAGLMIKVIKNSDVGPGGPALSLQGETAPLGELLFREYLLPFELVSVLLLVAMVGVILLSKKELN